jgi:hypothetical protein
VRIGRCYTGGMFLRTRFVTTFLLFASLGLYGAVTRVEISERSDLPVANYERLEGKVYFAVDPNLPENRIIVDLGRAPRNAKGQVEFSADLRILRPKDPSKRNGTMIMEVPNRGHSSLLQIGGGGGFNPMRSAKDIGDPWLLEKGFTLVWLGWEFDLPPQAGSFRLQAPVLAGVTGVVRSQIQTVRKTNTASLADRGMEAYPVADPSSGTMTVRDGIDGVRSEIPRSDWSFSADGKGVEYPKGFEPGRIYEVVYQGKDPAVVGVGLAAFRDYAAYARQQGDARYLIAYGMSQDGRFLRTFLYDGFNRDESGKKAFDGIWAHIAGGSRGGFNVRFGQPSHSRWFYPTDLPPFTPAGLMTKARQDGVAPKLILTNSSQEYWNSAASLVHTTPDGKKDVAPPPDVRLYHLAGTQHVVGGNAPGLIQYPANRMQVRWFMQTMMLALNDWITKGTEPPPSRYPTLAKGELTDAEHWKFPKIPGVAHVPISIYQPKALDFGPDFLSHGIISIEPPKVTGTYVTMVSQVDADGNEMDGVRMPELAVPLATYTGWNLRQPSIGAPDMRYGNIGSTFVFPKTKADRERAGDPRRSIEERYKDRDDYLERIEAAARQMVGDRLLLEQYVPEIRKHAEQSWQEIVGAK